MYKNIPNDVAKKAISEKRFTEAQLKTIDREIYKHCVPDWSEWSYGKIFKTFTSLLANLSPNVA